MKRAVYIAALAAAAIGVSPARANFYVGNQLLGFCRELDGDEIALCYGYLAGIVDARGLSGFMLLPFCVPAGVTARQVRDLVVRYLEAHPESRHKSASLLVGLALNEAFPCKGKAG